MKNKEAEVRRLVTDGFLATQELNEIGRKVGPSDANLVQTSRLTDVTDPLYYSAELFPKAHRMSDAYYKLYLFENKMREFIDKTMIASKGPKWFEEDNVVPDRIKGEAKRRMKEEGAARFHGARGGTLLSYVSLPDLGKIIVENWPEFQNIMYNREWVQGKFEDLRLTRNAVAHMGDASESDIERVEMVINDLNKQIG